MSDFYTITGRHTGRTWLVTAEDGRMWLFPPGSFTLPWVGASGHHYGLSYYPGSSTEMTGPPWLAGWRAQRIVNSDERRERAKRERRNRAATYASRRAAR